MKALLLGAMLASPAWAQDDVGVPVSVTVLDAEGAPIPTAVVRHPEEADRHRVNTSTGTWTGNVLYLPDGSEIIFEKDMQLKLEISAPGYVTESVLYQVRKRKNKVSITLQKMSFELDEDDMDDVNIQFGRDKPRD